MNTCPKLTKIEERTFCTCSHLTEIAFPPNVTEIGDFAFAWDHTLGTNRFNLPNALKTIGTGAFAFCTHLGIVNDIAIPAMTTNIGNWAFTCCFDLGRSAGGIDIYPGTPGAELALTIGTGAFSGCSSLEKINFPNRVAFINDYAFAACDKLERVSFGDRDGTETLHIRSIGDRAFDSLEDTGLSALRTIAAAYKEVDSGDDAYVDGSSTAAEAISGEVYDLSGVTPLKFAAFGGYPPALSAVVAAKENKHSFPRDVTIWYSNPDYNSAAYGQWRSAVVPGNPMSTWNGYNCEPMWVGHFHEYGEPDIVPRTCTQDGQEIYTCHVWQDGKECGHVEIVVTEKATGHDDEMIMSEAPTCYDDGVAYYHCSNEWCDHPDHSEILPALGHDYEHLQDYKAPTCLELRRADRHRAPRQRPQHDLHDRGSGADLHRGWLLRGQLPGLRPPQRARDDPRAGPQLGQRQRASSRYADDRRHHALYLHPLRRNKAGANSENDACAQLCGHRRAAHLHHGGLHEPQMQLRR